MCKQSCGQPMLNSLLFMNLTVIFLVKWWLKWWKVAVQPSTSYTHMDEQPPCHQKNYCTTNSIRCAFLQESQVYGHNQNNSYWKIHLFERIYMSLQRNFAWITNRIRPQAAEGKTSPCPSSLIDCLFWNPSKKVLGTGGIQQKMTANFTSTLNLNIKF